MLVLTEGGHVSEGAFVQVGFCQIIFKQSTVLGVRLILGYFLQLVTISVSRLIYVR